MDKQLETVFTEFKGKEEELIPILQKVQEKYSYLPEQAMQKISEFTKVPESRVYAVATFYAQFRFKPIGKYYILVCRGTSCHVRGAPRILEEIEKQLGIKEGETSSNMKFTLETVACIGACGLSPCIMINKKVYAKLTPKKVAELFANKGAKWK